MTYQLRRLRLHGLIERQPATHRYHVTSRGLRVSLFFTRSYARLIRPALGQVIAVPLPEETRLQQAFRHVDRAFDDHIARARI